MRESNDNIDNKNVVIVWISFAEYFSEEYAEKKTMFQHF